MHTTGGVQVKALKRGAAVFEGMEDSSSEDEEPCGAVRIVHALVVPPCCAQSLTIESQTDTSADGNGA